MKRHLLCRADELHHSLEVFFRENQGWEDAFICADEKGIFALRFQYLHDGTDVNIKPVILMGGSNGSSSS